MSRCPDSGVKTIRFYRMVAKEQEARRTGFFTGSPYTDTTKTNNKKQDNNSHTGDQMQETKGGRLATEVGAGASRERTAERGMPVQDGR